MKPPTSILAIRFVKAERAVDSIQASYIDISDLTSMPDVVVMLVWHKVCPTKDGKLQRVSAWIRTDDKDEWVAANEADLRKKMLLMVEFQEALIKKEFQEAIVRTNSWKLPLRSSFGPGDANQANADKAAAEVEVY